MRKEFQDYCMIDRDALDDELMRQPQIYMEVSEAYADAAAERDRLKEVIEVYEAEIALEIRKDAESDGDKITDKTVAAMVQADGGRSKRMQAFLDAKLDAEKLSALKEAIGQKTHALHDLSALFIAGYFVQTSANTKGATEAGIRENRRKINERRARMSE
jgi:hypothetical protein